MTTLNLSCTICSEDYGTNDEIVSTYCGHIFHNSCFQDWRSRSSSCPQCRVENAQTHRIYLHMEESPQRQISPAIQIEFENKISQLEHQLAESENDFLQLQQTHCGKEEEISELKTEIECQKAQYTSLDEEFSKSKLQIEETERNFFNLLEQINKLETDLKEKEIEIDFLRLQNRNKEEKLKELKIEQDVTKWELSTSEHTCLTLKDKLTLSEAEIIKLNRNISDMKIQNPQDNDKSKAQQQTSSELLLEEKVLEEKDNAKSNVQQQTSSELLLEEKVRDLKEKLDEKLKQMSVELNKEIGDFTALAVENMKLQGILGLTTSNEEKETIATKYISI